MRGEWTKKIKGKTDDSGNERAVAWQHEKACVKRGYMENLG
jgi:hypothetical protein